MKVVIKLYLFPIITLLLMSSSSSQARVEAMKVNVSLPHAKELLGKRSLKRLGIDRIGQETMAHNFKMIIKRSLRKKFKKYNHIVASSVLKAAKKHKFDPFFILAVISGESSFDPYRTGTVGEIGLMQLRPSTAKWIAKKFKIKFRGARTLKNPAVNIEIATAYLSYLRSKFKEESQLYLAAYNMGPTNVRKAIRKNIRPKDYPIHIMKRYIDYYKNLARPKAIRVAKI